MSRYDDLERLARLHSNGALSDEEFRQEKARLLAQPTGQPSSRQEMPASDESQSCCTQAQNTDDKITINVSPYSRLLALLLCFFLGNFGVHRFYTGRRKSALIMAGLGLISLLSCARLFGTNIDFSGFSSPGNRWEYFGEYTNENGSIITTYTKNSAAVFSTFLIAMASGIWRFIDFILIICGQFKDSKKRTLIRW